MESSQSNIKNSQNCLGDNYSTQHQDDHHEPASRLLGHYDIPEENIKNAVPVAAPVNRDQWSHPVEFLMSCLSMTVGIGNVWRFPSTAFENGGGAFLIPYIIVLAVISRPLYFMELSMGQFSSSGNVKVWKVVPAVKGIGFGQALGTWLTITYYCSVISLTVFYFLHSFTGTLPWAVCDPAWANSDCVDPNTNVTLLNTTDQQSSVEQFYYKYVLHYSDNIEDGIGIPDWKLSLCLLFCWIVLFFTLFRGVKTSGKVAYFTAIIPYLVLITLLIRGATLPGAYNGILYFITPQWGKLLELKVWYNAIIQSFFSLGVGYGSLMMLASYNDFKHDIYRDAWIMSLADTLTSLLAGFTVFSFLGYLAHELGKDVHDVVTAGNGLAFITYPEVLAKFDIAPQVFSILFFIMLFTLGIGSLAADTGVVITVVCDQFPTWKRPIVTFCICLISFLVGLVYVTPGGQWLLELVDFFVGGFVRFGLVVVEVIALNWIYGTTTFIRDVNFMLGRSLGCYWRICWSVLIPVTLSIILVYSIIDIRLPTMDGQYFPTSVYACGWMIPLAALLAVTLGFAHAVYGAPGQSLKQKLKLSFCTKKSWGPKKENHREEWEILKNSQNNSDNTKTFKLFAW